MMRFHIVGEEDIREGKTADVYFFRAKEILDKKGIRKRVVAEVKALELPKGWKWAVLVGIEEALRLLEGRNVNVWAFPEGTIFSEDEPVFVIEGYYQDFAVFETALLGFLCQASGVATVAARCKVAAQDRLLLSFGARRMHPAISLMIDRAAYIGGCDGVAVIKSAEFLQIEPKGTMPHAFILVVGKAEDAFLFFDEIEPPHIKRIALIDTFGDEKFEAIRAAEVLGERLFAVRLDTPSSRRGDFKALLEEVRWELDIRGYKNVKLLVSGGINEEKILQLREVVDAFGVGTSISSAPIVDFSLDIVEVEGIPISKRGKKSGRKYVKRCKKCYKKFITYLPQDDICDCGGTKEVLLVKFLEDGKIIRPLPSVSEIKDYVREQREVLSLSL